MRLVAAAAVALAVVVSLAGCGLAGRATTITIELPSAQRADAVTGHVATAHVALSSRRLNAGANTAHRTGSSGSRRTATVVQSTATPAIAPLTPAADARLNGVSVWVPYWGLSSAVSTAVDNASVVRVAHPFIYEITGSSTVVDQSGGQARSVTAELAAQHIDVIPTVTETAQMGAFAATLSHPKKQKALLNALVQIADQPGNDGIDLDFENLAIGTGNTAQAARVEALYPQLVGQLCATLHASDRSCEVTVMAKNNAGLQDADGLNTAVYDYSALAQVADRIQVMAYDDHVPSSAAGPIAPWPWVESVLDYALTQIPADKVVLGVPAYGYDWSSAGGATSLTAVAAEQLASQVHAQIQWNSSDAEPYFTYTTTSKTGKKTHTVHHTVWFEDSTANYDRAVLAADDKLAGIALWAAGDEQPGLWTMLERLAKR
jgi:spore germination protein